MKILAGICAALALGLLLALWRLDNVGTKLSTANGKVATLEAAAESRRNTQRLLATLDTEHTKALNDAQATNNQLRAAVASGAHRLSIKAACPAVRTATGAARVDDAETRADIDPAAAERVVAITNDGDEAIRALNGLQDYVNRVCLKGN
ncbi:MAG: lysis protein [Gammaproteobacteria bacterium]|nr:lysis protein [Gammaproteobacteria bacterium]MBU0821874.1 lysis protein [Gammaproteobacteria bacterium]MBU0843987.1 lysis protein [Gammaproteobacteria bacterium]MBU1842238.1 lysis protein [Gammaproteobacteria bacterium]